MSSVSSILHRAVVKGDFEAIHKLMGDLILSKQGQALSSELLRNSSLRKKYVLTFFPILQRWDYDQLISAGLDIVYKQLEQLTLPSAISAFACFAPEWYVIQGCRPSPGPVEIVVLTFNGEWMTHTITDGCFRSQISRHAEGNLGFNYSFVGILNTPDASGIKTMWINGTRVVCEIQNCSDSLYVDQIDDLLYLYRQAETPLDVFPDLIPKGVFELAKILSHPLKQQNNWSKCIRQENYFGAVTSASAHTTIVIPLYRLWHQFMQGHLAAFSMDSDFLSGQIVVMYVVDDPAIEYQVLNWARIYLHDCPYPVRIVSLVHNYGFGMACNVGVQAVHTPQVVLMNSDVMPIKPGWLQEMRHMWTHNPTALVSAVLLYDDLKIQHCGMNLAFSGTQTSPVPCNIHVMKGVHFDQSIDQFPDTDVWNVFAMTGALLAFNRELFLQVGGFDPIFGRGDFEDVDFSLRWKESIGPLLITRAAQLIHLERQTMNVLMSDQRQWQERFNSCCALHLNQTIQQQAEDAWS